MLSYQHIYHAGCLADIHKHAALSVLLSRMIEKDKPFTYIETHAGRGLYDLSQTEAQKTGEAKAGYSRMTGENWFAADHPYITAIKAIQKDKGENIYPGSAALAAHFLRSGDKMHLMELHPQERAHLEAAMAASRAKIYPRDGYEGLLALTPPQPRRGIVFIDPSYEIKSEYETLVPIVEQVMKKWSVAVLCVWYPLLNAGRHKDMVEKLQALELPESHVFETEFTREESARKGMWGSGLFVANLPFGTRGSLQNIGQKLQHVGME